MSKYCVCRMESSTRVGQGLGKESVGGEELLLYRGVREGISNNS